MLSVWSEKISLPGFERLERDISTQVLVIGGGMAGLLCAYMLNKAGLDCVLAEAKSICGGVTGNTTAKLSVQHGLIYETLIKKHGWEKAKMYLSANQQALKEFAGLCGSVDCGFEKADSYVYSKRGEGKIETELAALKSLGADAEYASGLPLPFEVDGAVKFPNQAQFDPLKFALAICGGLKIYEHTQVLKIVGDTAITERGRIRAEKIIVATHFPFINKHGSYFVKLYQQRAYVIALENAPKLEGMYVDEGEKGLSFRSCGDLLLLGGGGGRTGKGGCAWRELEGFAGKNYPQARIKYRWAAQDCMSLDGVPYIGRYCMRTPKLFVATGFNKWGMTGSMTAALILRDLVTDRENPYAAAFSPSRSMLCAQLAANTLEAAVSMAKPTKKRCPHMGCALKWNSGERSWDCPCHGSRFTEYGELIENPATGDLKI